MSQFNGKESTKNMEKTQLRKRLEKLFEKQSNMKKPQVNGRKNGNAKISEVLAKMSKNTTNMKTNENTISVRDHEISGKGLPNSGKSNSFSKIKKNQQNMKFPTHAGVHDIPNVANKESFKGLNKEAKASPTNNKKQKKEKNGTNAKINCVNNKAKIPNSNASKKNEPPKKQQSKNNPKEINNKGTTNGGVKSAEPKETKKKAKAKSQINGVSVSAVKRSASEQVDQPKEKKKKTLIDILEEPYNSYDDTDFEMSDSEDEFSEDSKCNSFIDSSGSSDSEEEQEESTENSDCEMYSDESSHAWSSYGEEYSDHEYRLPHDEVEDLIIHKGTAPMRPINKKDNVHFDSDIEDGQIKELNTGQSIPSVEQPKAYLREALNELNDMHTNSSPPVVCVKKPKFETDDCPKLVPIVDEEGFELFNPDMAMSDEDDDDYSDISLGSYEEVSDDEFSEDINSKYLKDESSDYDSDSESDMAAEVINTKTTDLKKDLSFLENQENNRSNESPKDELPSANWMESNVLEDNKTIVVESSILDEDQLVDEEAPSESSVEISNDDEISLTETTRQQTSQVYETPSRTFFCNAADSNYVLASLKDPFCIYGTVRLEVLVGSVELYGYVAGPGDELEVFSPRGCSSVQVVSKPNPNTKKSELRSKLLKLENYFVRKDLEFIADNFAVHTDALILLKRNEQCKNIVNTFRKHMNENVFPNINTLSLDRPHYTSEFLLGCLVTEANSKQLVVPPEWNAIPLEASSKIILAGGKSVGKSTLVRYLINRHIKQRKQVLLVDLDIGQPEMFVPQTVSCSVVTHPLLGPGWFLNRQPRKAFLVGNINPVLAPHTYLQAIRQLIEYCLAHDELKGMPWVVNTMGYNKGFGLELMALIRHLVQPTDIIQLESNKEVNNFDVLLDENGLGGVASAIYDKPMEAAPQTHRLHVLASAVRQESRFQKEWNMSAKDMRYAMVLARLSDALQGNAEFLNDCKPLCASLDNLKLVTMSPCEISQIDLAQSMKTSLVYLCHGNKEKDVESGQPLECLGLGVTRGFDSVHENIYLHPAMPVHYLATVNCLAISEMPLPTTLLMRQSSKIDKTCPYLYNTVVGKSTKSVKQIYHRPEEFLKGNHRNLVDLD